MSQNQFHSLKVASVARNTRDAVVVTFDLPRRWPTSSPSCRASI